MKFITDYKEFHSDSVKSVLDYVDFVEPANKQIILDYLKNGNDAGVRCSLVNDYIDNEHKQIPVYRFTDGEYKWTTEEIYHFEKYNVPLNNEFVKKVMKASS